MANGCSPSVDRGEAVRVEETANGLAGNVVAFESCVTHAAFLSGRLLIAMASARCFAMSSPSSRQDKMGNVRGWMSR